MRVESAALAAIVKYESLDRGQDQEKDVSQEVYRQKTLGECPEQQDDQEAEPEVRHKEQDEHSDEFEERAEGRAETDAAGMTVGRVISDPRSKNDDQSYENDAHAKPLDVAGQAVIEQRRAFFDEPGREPEAARWRGRCNRIVIGRNG